jgi:hypothetical protein
MSIKARVPSLKEVFTFEHVANGRHWKEVTAAATPEFIAQIKPISDSIRYEDAATIIYTSGTTHSKRCDTEPPEYFVECIGLQPLFSPWPAYEVAEFSSAQPHF